jgi:predicted GNAT family acetyltransferase
MISSDSDIRIADILHVFVPKKHRGHGIAEGFVRKMLEIAEKYSMKIRPTCTYVRNTFANKFPHEAQTFFESQNLLTDNEAVSVTEIDETQSSIVSTAAIADIFEIKLQARKARFS